MKNKHKDRVQWWKIEDYVQKKKNVWYTNTILRIEIIQLNPIVWVLENLSLKNRK